MTDDTSASNPTTDASKPVEDWVTGDEPATGPQRSYLQTLGREAGEDIPDDLTKAQASEMIDRLQQKSGRGADSSGGSGGIDGSDGTDRTDSSGATDGTDGADGADGADDGAQTDTPSADDRDMTSFASPEAAVGEESGAASDSSNDAESGVDSGGGSEFSTGR